MTDKPQYTHDCDICVFLGTHLEAPDGDVSTEYDLYYCPSAENVQEASTVIARWGSYGPDYMSGNVFSRGPNGSSALKTARLRAEALGVKVPNE